MTRNVAILSYAETSAERSERDETELLLDVIPRALAAAGVEKRELGFSCGASADLLVGRPFTFVTSVDAVGAWPPISQSHVEMDGAWAMYEAWVRILTGEVDVALVYAFGRASLGPLRDVLCLQLDPYVVGPLWPDSIALAALQARALLDSGRATETDFARVAARVRGDRIESLLAEPYLTAPLRVHDCPPITDGAAAMILAAGAVAERAPRKAWITGCDHRIEPHSLGVRDLTRSPSTELAAEHAGARRLPIELAELHTPFSHQELIVRDALRLGDSVSVNPSGGALAANPMMVAGLARVGAAAARVMDGSVTRALAHATSGPCLQQNLVCLLGKEVV